MRTEPELPAAARHTAQTQPRQTLDRKKLPTPAHTDTRSRWQGRTPTDNRLERDQHTLKEVSRLQQGCRRQQLLLTLIVSCTLSNLTLVATHSVHYHNSNAYAKSTQAPLPRDLPKPSTASATLNTGTVTARRHSPNERLPQQECRHSSTESRSLERPPQQEWHTCPERQRPTHLSHNHIKSDHLDIVTTAPEPSAASKSHGYPHTSNPTLPYYHRLKRLTPPQICTTIYHTIATHTTELIHPITQKQHITQCSPRTHLSSPQPCREISHTDHRPCTPKPYTHMLPPPPTPQIALYPHKYHTISVHTN